MVHCSISASALLLIETRRNMFEFNCLMVPWQPLEHINSLQKNLTCKTDEGHCHRSKKSDWMEKFAACDEPIFKPIDSHIGETIRSSVFASKAYWKALEIYLQFNQYVPFDNIKHKYCYTMLWGLHSIILLFPTAALLG